MPVADLDTFRSKTDNPWQPVPITKSGPTSVAAARAIRSMWTVAPFAGTTPAGAVAPSMATTGAMEINFRQNPGGGNDLWLAAVDVISSVPANVGMHLMLIDRLSHMGGLSATTTTAQNVNTAALTRYTLGAGVMMGVEIYTQIGTTATTLTASYTDQDNNSGITSPVITFGGTSYREVNTLLVLPLAEGDTGVRSVQTVTVAATTGTAGNFGVTLFKPLALIPLVCGMPTSWNALMGGCGQLAEIADDACLGWMVVCFAGQTTSATIHGQVRFIEA